MQTCKHFVGQKQRGRSWCCYGAQGCTHPLLSETGSVSEKTEQSTGQEPRQASGSPLIPPSLRLELSSDASLQDLYLILRAFYEGGFDVSVTAQATPKSRRLHSDIVERYISWMLGGPLIGWPPFSDAPGQSSNDTTPSSKTPEKSWTCPRDGKKFKTKAMAMKHYYKMHKGR